MRLVVALFTSALILLASWLYLKAAERPPTLNLDSESSASAPTLRIELELTFAAGPDPFAENLDDAPSLVVSSEGKTLLRMEESIAAGQRLIIDDLAGFKAGPRELLIEATPQDPTSAAPRAVRVSVYRTDRDRPLTTEILWSAPGSSKVDGVVAVTLPENSPATNPAEEQP
ncbi:MAG: hypothetical protein WD045_06725 [Pirellulaceae bacterium]